MPRSAPAGRTHRDSMTSTTIGVGDSDPSARHRPCTRRPVIQGLRTEPMSVILLTLPLLWAQVNPAAPGSAARAGRGAGRRPRRRSPSTPPRRPRPAAPRRSPAAARMPALPPIDQKLAIALAWLYFAGDPDVRQRRPCSAGCITWVKAISLLCLVGWVFSWLVDRHQGAGRSAAASGSTTWASPP